MINTDQDFADGVILLGMNLAHQNRTGRACQPARTKLEVLHVREQQAHRGIKGDRKHCRDDHREVFGISQWPEKSAFLRLQSEHRQKRNSDYQRAKKLGPPTSFTALITTVW